MAIRGSGDFLFVIPGNRSEKIIITYSKLYDAAYKHTIDGVTHVNNIMDVEFRKISEGFVTTHACFIKKYNNITSIVCEETKKILEEAKVWQWPG